MSAPPASAPQPPVSPNPTLRSNEGTKFQARELKSVHVSVTASALKLHLHKCHLNKLNIYNQVGIVAINILGEPVRDGGMGGGGRGGGGGVSADPQYLPRRPAGSGSIPIDLSVDPVTAETIRDLLARKDAAVDREDFDEAKRLKEQIGQIKAVGMKIALLESRKKAAIDAEDYDAAKVIKADIAKLRNMSHAEALGHDMGGGHGGGHAPQHMRSREPQAPRMGFVPEDPYERPPENDDPYGESPPLDGGGGYDGGGGGGYDSGAPLHYDERPAVGKAALDASGGVGRYEFGENELEQAAPTRGDPPVRFPLCSISLFSSRLRHFPESFRPNIAPLSPRLSLTATTPLSPIPFRSPNPHSTPTPPRPTPPQKRSDAAALGDDADPNDAPRFNPAAEGFSADLPPAEPLSATDLKDSRPLIDLVGEYSVMCLFSRNWVLREAAVTRIDKLLSSGQIQSDDDRESFRVLTRGIQRLFKDKARTECPRTDCPRITCVRVFRGERVSIKEQICEGGLREALCTHGVTAVSERPSPPPLSAGPERGSRRHPLPQVARDRLRRHRGPARGRRRRRRPGAAARGARGRLKPALAEQRGGPCRVPRAGEDVWPDRADPALGQGAQEPLSVEALVGALTAPR